MCRFFSFLPLENLMDDMPTVLALNPKGSIDYQMKWVVLNTNLTELHLNRIRCDLQTVHSFSLIPSLTILDLSCSLLWDREATELFKSSNLTALNLAHNMVKDKALEGIYKNTVLTSLDLCNNCIRYSGTQELAKSTTLLSLNLSRNGITEKNFKELIQNTILTTLNVSNNEIGALKQQIIFANTTLTSLNLDLNRSADFSGILNQVKLNERNLAQRRSEFIRILILLMRSPQDSRWKQFPPDMRKYILIHLGQSFCLGVPIDKIKNLISLMDNNLEKINKMIGSRTDFRIGYSRDYKFALISL